MMPTTETGAVESDGVTAASVAVPMDPIITTTGPTAVVANHVLPLAGEAATKNRLANTTVCLPIVYGSIAFFLGKKADEYHTHKWTLYLRGPNDEDLGVCIQKVVFQLHPSFAQPVRELTDPPFEVTERGWGEFEAQIRIVWKDSSEKATVVNHGIKLYPQGSTNMQPTKEPVVAEVYDEVVFTDPKESFFQSLMKVAEVPKIPFPDDAVQACVQRYSDEDDFQALLEAQKFLQKELQQVKSRMKMTCEEMDQVDAALKEVLEAKKAVRNNTTGNTASASAPTATKPKSVTSTAPAPVGHVAKKPKI